MAVPSFAVVGHPNKGKSSLVATLAEDDSVPIAPESGTTRRAARFPMRVRGEVLYELIDTPGFQRARATLEWLQSQASSAAERPEAVRRFVEHHVDDRRFVAECELLRPLVNGAGIIYVVDGAVPYGPEYEAEMEVLRWTGRPSMALINAIGEPLYVAEWRNALTQYFRTTREVDVLSAPLEQRLDLLRAFGELDPQWRPALDRAVDALLAERAAAKSRSARIVAELLVDALLSAPERRLAADDDPVVARKALEQSYQEQLRELERHARERVEQTYHHAVMARSETLLELVDADLFEQKTWELFGLSRGALAGLGATGGGAAGAGLDAALGGASLLLGTVLGAATGVAATWYAANRFSELETVELPFGEQVLRIKPGASKNLPFVLLGRARLHHALVARRSHAARDALIVDGAESLNPLTMSERAELDKLFGRIVRGGLDAAEHNAAALCRVIEPLLEPPAAAGSSRR